MGFFVDFHSYLCTTGVKVSLSSVYYQWSYAKKSRIKESQTIHNSLYNARWPTLPTGRLVNSSPFFRNVILAFDVFCGHTSLASEFWINVSSTKEPLPSVHSPASRKTHDNTIQTRILLTVWRKATFYFYLFIFIFIFIFYSHFSGRYVQKPIACFIYLFI